MKMSTPWNVPNDINLKKLGWAMAAGCTVVLKDAPTTSWCSNFLAEIIATKTDVPAGAVNVLTSEDNAAVGEAIINDPRVDMVGFTGSTGVGKHIGEVRAQPQACSSTRWKSAAILMPNLPMVADAWNFGLLLPGAGLRDHDALLVEERARRLRRCAG